MVAGPRKKMKSNAGFGDLIREKHCFTMWQTRFTVDTNYVPLKPIGKGAYGVVCSSMNTETMERVAIKKINNVFENRVDALRALREIVILKNVCHENVIGLKDVMVSNSRLSLKGGTPTGTSMANFKDVYMVYDLMDTDLNNIIKSPQPISNDHCKYFLFQLLKGLKYLHSSKILHRDLKPGNLLVNADCELKICDFGLARSTTGDIQFMTEYVVTRWYRAPELLLCCDDYGTSIDVWSVGCILAELLGRKPIFAGNNSLTQLKLIINVLGTQDASSLKFVDGDKARRFIDSLPHTKGTPFASLYPQADPLAIDLLQKMLIFDPTKRITVDEALHHPYLAGLDDPLDEEDDPPFPFDLNIDDNMEEEMIRELIWTEMMCYSH